MAIAERTQVGAIRDRLHQGAVWYNESGAKPNTIVRFDPATEKFQSWVIPGGGDIVRNMDVTRDGNPVLANSLTNEVGLVDVNTEPSIAPWFQMTETI
jgi:streptogramin lyase